MRDFYTIGLPRSRSLWLSKFLAYGDATCFHEHLSMHDKERRPTTSSMYRGFCDTNPLIGIDYGSSPVLIVKRDPGDVIESALKCFDVPDQVSDFRRFLSNYMVEYETRLNELNPECSMTVAFDDLNKRLEEICDFLMPENKVPEGHIESMVGTRIQTTNRNLTASLKHTADALGVPYAEFVERYDVPAYTCERIWNHQTVVQTMNMMWDDISEDGAPPYVPDLLNEYYVAIMHDGKYIGMYRFHQHSSVMWEGHAFILGEHRGHATGTGMAIKRWVKNNLEGAEKIIANVPECFPNVIGFLKHMGFKEQGYNSDSYTKNGLVGVYQLGMLVRDM